MKLLPSKKTSGRRSIKVAFALATTAAIVAMGMTPAAANHDGEAHAWSESVSGEGQLFTNVAQILQPGRCTADFTNGGPLVTSDQCTSSVDTSPANAVVRFATANVAEPDGAATSSAEAAVASVPLTDFAQLDLLGIFQDLAQTQPNSSAIQPLLVLLGCAAVDPANPPANCVGDPTTGTLFPLVAGLNTAVQQVLLGVQAQLPLDLVVTGIFARCNANASTATGDSGVAELALTAQLGPENINVPLSLANVSHYRPVASPSVLLDEIIWGDSEANLTDGGLQEALNTSFGGQPAPLAAALVAINNQAIHAILDPLEAQLLGELEQALRALIEIEINHTTANSEATNVDGPWSQDNETEVTAFRLTLLQGGGAQAAQTLRIGRVHCGDNRNGGPHGGGPGGLQIVKDEDVKGDDEVQWTIRVRNPNADAVENVLVKDFYPDGVDKDDIEVSSGPSQGSFNKDTGVWNVGTLASGAVATLKIRAEVDEDDLEDGIENVVCVVTNADAKEPNKVQSNKNFDDDTDGCDDAESEEDDDDSPKSVNSGIGAGGDLSAVALAGLMAMTAMGGSVARRRFRS